MADRQTRTAQQLDHSYYGAVGTSFSDLEKLGITANRGEIIGKELIAEQLAALSDAVTQASGREIADPKRASAIKAALTKSAENILKAQSTAASSFISAADAAMTGGATAEDKINFSYTGDRAEEKLKDYEDKLQSHLVTTTNNLKVAERYYSGPIDVTKLIQEVERNAGAAKLEAHNTAAPMVTSKADIDSLLTQVSEDAHSAFAMLGISDQSISGLATMAPARQVQLDAEISRNYNEIKDRLTEARRLATKTPPHPTFEKMGTKLDASLQELDDAFGKIDSHAKRQTYCTQLDNDQKALTALGAAFKSKNHYQALGLDRPESEPDRTKRAAKIKDFAIPLATAVAAVESNLTAIATRNPSLKVEVQRLLTGLRKMDETLKDNTKREAYDLAQGLPAAPTNKDFRREMNKVFSQITESKHTAFEKLGLPVESDVDIRSMGTAEQALYNTKVQTAYDDLTEKLRTAKALAAATPADPDFKDSGLSTFIDAAQTELDKAKNQLTTHADRGTYTQKLAGDTKIIKDLEDNLKGKNLYELVDIPRPESLKGRRAREAALSTFNNDVDTKVADLVAKARKAASDNPSLHVRAEALVHRLEGDVKDTLKDPTKRNLYDEGKGLAKSTSTSSRGGFFGTSLWRNGSPFVFGIGSGILANAGLASTTWGQIAILGGTTVAAWVGPLSVMIGVGVLGYSFYRNYRR